MSRKLTPNQIEAAALLAMGNTQKYAALSVGVCADTLSRWGKQARFNAEIEKKQNEARAANQKKIARIGEFAALALLNELTSDVKSKRVEVAFRLIEMLGAERVFAPASVQHSEPITLENKSTKLLEIV